MRVLVVEDEMPLADAVARGLRRHGMSVDLADNGDDGYDGYDGYDKANSLGYDVLDLDADRDLPGRSGDEICQSVTAAGAATRGRMLTASGSDHDRAIGLTLGASDHLTKPFQFTELVHRVQVLGELPAAI